MTHTTERPQRIPLGNSGYFIEGRSIYKYDEGWIKIATFMQFQAKGQNQAAINEFAAALNGMQPDVTGDVVAALAEKACEVAGSMAFPPISTLDQDSFARGRAAGWSEAYSFAAALTKAAQGGKV